MIETLTNKLIAIKKEILALKTAYKHGLGTMKLFSYTIDPPSSVGSSFVGDVVITVSISQDSAPYPLIDISSSNYYQTYFSGVEASNDGRTFIYAYELATNPSFKVISSSEATVSVDWIEYNG